MKPLEICWIYKIETEIICSLVSQRKGKKTSKNFINILKETSKKGKSKEISLSNFFL